MELLIVLAVIWFVSSLVTSGKKKQTTNKPTAEKGAAKPAAPQVRERMPREAFETIQPSFGDSLMDEAGCIGGSITHTSHEGTHAPGSMNVVAREGSIPAARRRTPAPSPVRKEQQNRLTPEQMRQAVVLSEVLDRPVAMRRSRTGGTRR